jgi:hypothetical protein
MRRAIPLMRIGVNVFSIAWARYRHPSQPCLRRLGVS